MRGGGKSENPSTEKAPQVGTEPGKKKERSWRGRKNHFAPHPKKEKASFGLWGKQPRLKGVEAKTAPKKRKGRIHNPGRKGSRKRDPFEKFRMPRRTREGLASREKGKGTNSSNLTGEEEKKIMRGKKVERCSRTS